MNDVRMLTFAAQQVSEAIFYNYCFSKAHGRLLDFPFHQLLHRHRQTQHRRPPRPHPTPHPRRIPPLLALHSPHPLCLLPRLAHLAREQPARSLQLSIRREKPLLPLPDSQKHQSTCFRRPILLIPRSPPPQPLRTPLSRPHARGLRQVGPMGRRGVRTCIESGRGRLNRVVKSVERRSRLRRGVGRRHDWRRRIGRA